MNMIETIKLMLDALENHTAIKHPQQIHYRDRAIEAGRQAIADAEKQEPKCVVIVEVFGKDWRLEYMSLPVGRHKLYTQQYLYTHPQPKREPLTDEQIAEISVECATVTPSDIYFARAIEAVHGIKGEA